MKSKIEGCHWRDRVTNHPELVDLDINWLDPRDNDQSSRAAYTAQDIHMCTQADIIFLYMGEDNPVGYNAAFECGIGLQAGAEIHSIIEPNRKGWEMVKEVSTSLSYDFDDGCMLLKHTILGTLPNYSSNCGSSA